MTGGTPRRVQPDPIAFTVGGAVIVGRGTQWGSPWVIRERLANQPTGMQAARWSWDVENADTGHFERSCPTRAEAHTLAARLYAEFTLPYRLDHGQIDLAPLTGRDLACWCPPWADCHAETLLRRANL